MLESPLLAIAELNLGKRQLPAQPVTGVYSFPPLLRTLDRK